MRFDAKEFGGRISIIMDENVWNKMKDTGAFLFFTIFSAGENHGILNATNPK